MVRSAQYLGKAAYAQYRRHGVAVSYINGTAYNLRLFNVIPPKPRDTYICTVLQAWRSCFRYCTQPTRLFTVIPPKPRDTCFHMHSTAGMVVAVWYVHVQTLVF